VRKNKVLPFETKSDGTLIQVVLGERGESWITRDMVGVRIWKGLENLNLKPGRNKLMIIGETDSGKSTLTSYLVNIALVRNLRTAVIDGDIGQGDLIPPGCIGAAVVKERVYDLRDLHADIMGFVGFTSPFSRYVRDLIVKRMKRIISYLEERGYDLCIINTDGYVSGEGMGYKLDMVRELKPDTVICFRGPDEELFENLKDFDNPPSMISVDRSEGIVKSASERNERRLSQYFRFLRDGKDMSVDLKKIRLDFMGIVYEHNLSDVELRESGLSSPDMEHNPSNLFAKGADDRVIVFRSNIEDVVEVSGRFTTFNRSSLEGMFAGLGSGGDVSGFARIIGLNQDQTLTLNTNFKGKFDTLFLGGIRLSPDLGTEDILQVVRRG